MMKESVATAEIGKQSETKRLPGLEPFRTNPFRVLRLSASATATQALWKAEKGQTMARAGLPVPGDDPLPWLSDVDPIEIQEAAQKMEEPLRRLSEQLFWFDFEGDPKGELLRFAIEGNDARALKQALALGKLKNPQVSKEQGSEPVDNDGEHDIEIDIDERGEEPLDVKRMKTMTQRINQANLRLLVGFAALHGIGPKLKAKASKQNPDNGSLPVVRLEVVDGMQIAEDVHEQLPKIDAEGSSTYKKLLKEAYSRWASILTDKDWSDYLRHLIARLGDDLVSGEDSQTLASAVGVQLADMLVGEIKQSVIVGQWSRTTALMRIAKESGTSPEQWAHALRPLRYVFRAEIEDLATMIEEPAPASLDNLTLYLERIAALCKRWEKLDPSEMLGLALMLDDGIKRLYGRLESLIRSFTVSQRLESTPDVQRILYEAKKHAQSASLRERLQAMIARLDQLQEHACHFCGQRAGSEFPSVISCQKETDRKTQYDWLGRKKSETIYYETRRRIVQRCDACATFHEYLKAAFWTTTQYAMICLAMTCICFAIYRDDAGVLFRFILCFPLPFLVGYASENIATWRLTPKDHCKPDEVRSTQGWRELEEDARGCPYKMSVDSGKNAAWFLRPEKGNAS